MDPYDITEAIADIEDELISSIIRNMKRHHLEEITEKKQWTMWQVTQLEVLERYKKENQRKYKRQFKDINSRIEMLIREANEKGYMDQEIEILEAIKNGFKDFNKASDTLQAEFFKLNERKLEALINATMNDMQKAETAILRMANDKYRQVIYNAQVYANTGAGTYEKAVDMATKDMLSAGLNCVQYVNGARHTLEDYADMAIRTASKRAYLQGEGTKRQEWGITTVIVNKRGNPCPKCLPFCGKVLIDDVWSGGSSNGVSNVTGLKYPLMSKAVAAGLYHPRCRDVHTTYFEGISTPPDDKYTKEELRQIADDYRKGQQSQYAKRQAEKYDRLSSYSLDLENKKHYGQKKKAWESKITKRYAVTDEIKEHREDTPQKMINLVEKYTSDEFVILNETAEDAFAYDPNLDAVVINVKHRQYQYLDYREIMIHELAHRIDQNELGTPMNLQFSDAIIEAEKRLLKNADTYKKMFEPGGQLEYNRLISDIMGCITDNVIVGLSGHDSQYIGIPGYTELEVFADMFSVFYQGDDESIKFLKEELPDVCQAFFKMVGE